MASLGQNAGGVCRTGSLAFDGVARLSEIGTQRAQRPVLVTVVARDALFSAQN